MKIIIPLNVLLSAVPLSLGIRLIITTIKSELIERTILNAPNSISMKVKLNPSQEVIKQFWKEEKRKSLLEIYKRYQWSKTIVK